MQTLFLYENFIYNGYHTNYLIIIDTVCIISAISVVVSKNPIISVLFLISLFLGISCHLIFSGVNFIGLSYLLVYVGAVSILFLFILMLINIRISELVSDTSNTVPLALIIGIAFNYPVFQILSYNISKLNILGLNNMYVEYLNNDNFDGYKYSNLITDITDAFFISSKNWDNNLSEITYISNIGDIMYTNYSVWLIITSIILLLSMVGAIVITIKKPQM